MNTSSLTTAPWTDPRTFYGCPDWCDRTDHHADVVSPKYPPIHYRHFGMVVVEARASDTPAGGCLGQHDQKTLDDMTPDQLRTLAADALAAAEWLEAQR